MPAVSRSQLSKQTEKSFARAQFDDMKPGAVLVNTARYISLQAIRSGATD